MKDIGYYAGFLSADDQQRINDASLPSMAVCLVTIADFIYQEHNDPDDRYFLAIDLPKSDRDKLALIRGLCDQIEIKLMQVAK